MYNWVIAQSSHPKAMWIVNIISFAESSFFPLPPDLMIIPMVLAERNKAFMIALTCTITSIVGGWVGYAIGYYVYEALGAHIIDLYNLEESFANFQTSFNKYGFWIIALKGLTPIPYKLVTIASGVAALDFWTFTWASVIARGFRFITLCSMLYFCGPMAKKYIEEYLGWAFAIILVTIVGGFYLFKVAF